ncbi:MAG: hypothetical protein GKR96_12595 [Gammaproteobacteria bacterium]|nr:hypothetical protein [Gammaproteobacteria bacterium]
MNLVKYTKVVLGLTIILLVGVFSTQSSLASAQDLATDETGASAETLTKKHDATQFTAGFRVGEDTLEPFADFLIPLYDKNGGTLLLNPRFSHKDEGEFEGNLGLVWRKMLTPQVIVGANVYVDTRRSRFGNRFNQAGVGVEVLSRWVDARVNWYDADSSAKLATESRSQETSVSTLAQTSTATNNSTSFSAPTPRGYLIVQDYTTTTTLTTTITETQTTTTKDRVFQEFEAGLDGYDAEIGFNLSLSPSSPDVRLFAGVYDFQGEFGRKVEGQKARVEVKAGPYVTFDAEFFEDDALNGTDYFLGARLHIPLKGRNTWQEFRQNFRLTGSRPFSNRKYTDMVMRDVRVQTNQSGLIEDVSRRTETEEVSRSSTSTSSTTTVSGTSTLRDKITFVDNSRAAAGADGTFENPYGSIGTAVFRGPTGNTVYVEGQGGDVYDEEVGFIDSVVIIGSATPLEINGGTYVGSGVRPTVRHTGGGAIFSVGGDIVLSGLRIEGAGSNVNGNDGIYFIGDFTASQSFALDNLIISNAGDDGINFENAGRDASGPVAAALTNVVIQGSENNGINFSLLGRNAPSLTTNLTDVTISDSGASGLHFGKMGEAGTTPQVTTLRNVTITDTDEAGMVFDASPGSFVFDNVNFSGTIGRDGGTDETLLRFGGADNTPIVVPSASGTISNSTTNTPVVCRGAFAGSISVGGVPSRWRV